MPKTFRPVSAAAALAALAMSTSACERHDWDSVKSLHQDHHGEHGPVLHGGGGGSSEPTGEGHDHGKGGEGHP